MRTPRPALQAPMRVRGSPVARRKARAPADPKLRGMATSSSYSSPLRAAARGATPGQQGTRSSSIVIAMPDAAATCPASPANPSEMSIMARAPRRASHRPAAMRGTGRAQRRQREPRASKPPSHPQPVTGTRAAPSHRPLGEPEHADVHEIAWGAYQVSPEHSRADTPRGRADADHDLHGG